MNYPLTTRLGSRTQWQHRPGASPNSRISRGNEALIFLLTLWSMFALLPASLAAEGSVSNAPAARPANRYLFVVETSRSMQRRSDAVLKSIQNMLGTAMGGQLHRGDTVGIWTYDSDIHSGRFPLQLWTPEMQKAITLRAMGFLNDQSYQKTGRLLKVLPILDR